MLLSLPLFAQPYEAGEILRHNLEIANRFQAYKGVKLKNRVTIAVIGDYIHTERFSHLLDINEAEIDGNHIDDDQNGFEDDYFGVNMNTANGRLYGPVMSGHENGIVSLLDAFINEAGFGAAIKVLPINITSDILRFDDQYIKKLADAIDYARMRGAQVISMSLGVPTDIKAFFEFIDRDETRSRAYYLAAVRRARDAGILMVGANSNNPDRDLVLEPVTPTNSPGVISVANVNFSGVMQSAYGRNVDLAFYGTGITVWGGAKEGYRVVKGASYATPLVAFAVAVGKSLKPDLTYDNVSLLRKSCERPIVGRKNISSGCVFSPEKFIKTLQTPRD